MHCREMGRGDAGSRGGEGMWWGGDEFLKVKSDLYGHLVTELGLNMNLFQKQFENLQQE